MKITFFGTTTFLFDDGKDQILVDCNFTRPSLVKAMLGQIQTNEAFVDEIFAKHKIDRLKAVFVSHSHHDHVMDAAYIANKTGAKVFGSKSTLNVCRGGSVSENRMVQYVKNETYEVGDFKVTVIPSVHSKPGFYNNNIGEEILEPLKMPAKMKDFKEGGTSDFLIENNGKRFLLHLCLNCLDGQFEDISADIMFLGIAGLSKTTLEERNYFFGETIDKVCPTTIIPAHWDNFFKPMNEAIKGVPSFIDNLNVSMNYLTEYCDSRNIECILQMPETFVEF